MCVCMCVRQKENHRPLSSLIENNQSPARANGPTDQLTFCAFCMAACTGPSLATTFSCADGSFTCIARVVVDAVSV